MTNEEIAKPVGHIPSGLFIVSLKDGEQMDGYLASWVQQCSFQPLQVAVAIKPDRPGYEKIIEGHPFSVNIVGEHEMKYLRHFWNGYAPGESPFKEIDHNISENGTIHLTEAKSTIDCRCVDKVTPGDHVIVFAEVIGGKVHEQEAKPKVHIRKTGLDY